MIVVVGGGLIGSCIAFELHQAGEEVLVLDADLPGAAWRAGAGLLTPSGERLGGTALEHDAKESLALWPDFARRLEAAAGQSVGFRLGLYRVALSECEAELLEGEAEGEKCALPLPHLKAARSHENEGCVHPPSVRAAALAAIRVVKARVQRIEPLGSGVVVDADGMRLEADLVILCCGAWSEQFGLAVRAVQGQALLLDGSPDLPALYGLPESGESQYALGRPDGLYVGATSRETTTEEVCPDSESRLALRQKAERLLGESALGTPIVKQLVGFRPMTSDGMPFVGAHPTLENVLVATGHSRHGVLLAPLTARRVLRMVQDAKMIAPLEVTA